MYVNAMDRCVKCNTLSAKCRLMRKGAETAEVDIEIKHYGYRDKALCL